MCTILHTQLNTQTSIQNDKRGKPRLETVAEKRKFSTKYKAGETKARQSRAALFEEVVQALVIQCVKMKQPTPKILQFPSMAVV